MTHVGQSVNSRGENSRTSKNKHLSDGWISARAECLCSLHSCRGDTLEHGGGLTHWDMEGLCTETCLSLVHLFLAVLKKTWTESGGSFTVA